MTRHALRSVAAMGTLALALTGCGRCTSPTQTPSPAAAPDVATETTSAPAQEAAVKSTELTYVLDSARSKMRMRRAAHEVEKPLEFTGVSGTATVDGGRLKRVNVQVDLRTLTGDERVTDLKDVDWLNVADFPTATFTTTLVDDRTTGEDSHQLGGLIELHGQPLDYGFPANVAITETEVQGSAEIYLDARRFGVPQTEDTVYTVNADLVFVRPAP